MSARRWAVLPLACTVLFACGCTGPDQSGMDGMPGMADMPSMTTVAAPAEAAPTGDGLAAAEGGYRLVLDSATVPPSSATAFTFRLTGPDGRAVTRYQPDDGALVQFDLIRADLTNYQHLDPAMRQDGTWVVALPALPSGAYRAYATFAAPNAAAGTPRLYRLSQPFTVTGPAADTAPPAPAATAEVGGYAVTLSGQPVAGQPGALRVAISSGGQPVAYLQRYLDGYAHLTAFRGGDLAAARLGPAERATARAELTSQAWFPEPGTWRVLVGFRTSGPLLTAGFTITVR
jgi:hypothetical protein